MLYAACSAALVVLVSSCLVKLTRGLKVIAKVLTVQAQSYSSDWYRALTIFRGYAASSLPFPFGVLSFLRQLGIQVWTGHGSGDHSVSATLANRLGAYLMSNNTVYKRYKSDIISVVPFVFGAPSLYTASLDVAKQVLSGSDRYIKGPDSQLALL